MDRPFSKLPPVGEKRIFIAVPMAKYAMMHAETSAYCSMMNQHPNIVWGFVNAMSPEFSRNSLLEHHFHNDPNWTHVFFIDSDIVPPQDALKKMLELDADIATGVYPLFMSTGVFWSVSDKNDDWIPIIKDLPKEPVETKSCGGGCLLIRREVLVDIKWPWFKTEYQEIYLNEGKGIKIGEDVYFCKKAIDKGYKIILEPTVVCKHYNAVDMLKFFEVVKGELAKNSKTGKTKRQSKKQSKGREIK